MNATTLQPGLPDWACCQSQNKIDSIPNEQLKQPTNTSIFLWAYQRINNVETVKKQQHLNTLVARLGGIICRNLATLQAPVPRTAQGLIKDVHLVVTCIHVSQRRRDRPSLTTTWTSGRKSFYFLHDTNRDASELRFTPSLFPRPASSSRAAAALCSSAVAAGCLGVTRNGSRTGLQLHLLPDWDPISPLDLVALCCRVARLGGEIGSPDWDPISPTQSGNPGCRLGPDRIPIWQPGLQHQPSKLLLARYVKTIEENIRCLTLGYIKNILLDFY